MGTGSTRKRRMSKYEQYRESGTGPTYDTEGMRISDKSMPWPGYDENGRQITPGTPSLSYSVDQYGIPRGMVTPHIEPPKTLEGYGLGDIGMQGGRGRGGLGVAKRAAQKKFLEALHAGDPEPPTEQERMGAMFESMYGDQTGDIKAAYGAREAAINRQYDTLLGRLGNEHGAAERGVRAEGQQLQSALTAIGADATAQLAASNRAIDQDYAKALRAVNNDYKPLAADLKASGASGAGLRAEAAAGSADLREAQNADTTLGRRYSQMLQQEINNRQATGATVTTANVGDLARILAQSRDNANVDRMKAVAQVEAQMAGDLAQAKSQKASAKYSFFLDALKAGGTLGEAAEATLTPGQRLKAQQDYIKSGVVDWKPAFADVDKSDNPEEIALGQEFRTRIQTSKTPLVEAQRAWQEWSKRSADERKQFPRINEALLNAMGLSQSATADVGSARVGMEAAGF